MLSQGAKAVQKGRELESAVRELFEKHGLSFKEQVVFEDCYFNSRAKMDFYIEDFDCAVECKAQSGSGTADQKLPFVYENLMSFGSGKGLLILAGDHYLARTGIHRYLESKVNDTFQYCFLSELEDWILEQTNSGPKAQ